MRRGHHDEEAFKTAHAILDARRHHRDVRRGRALAHGELGKPRHGLGRLALESGAPVVPTAIAGTERVRNWKRLQFPQVTVQFGEPLRFEQVEEPSREQAQAASEIVFDARQGRSTRGCAPRDAESAVRAARAARRAARAARGRRRTAAARAD